MASKSFGLQDASNELNRHPLPPHITIEPITAENLSAFRRIVSLLLPIRYPDKFFSEILQDDLTSSISRVAVWHHTPPQTLDGPNGPEERQSKSKCDNNEEEFTVIGGIRCRLEPFPVPSSEPGRSQLYIQTLALLSPYRGQGIATALLDAVLTSVLSPAIVQQDINVGSVYAHVWEANKEGLEWYKNRGFTAEKEVLEGYYWKLKPRGAIIVRKPIGVHSMMALKAYQFTRGDCETAGQDVGEKL